MPASEAQIRANRKNAARSTGPRTPSGKERSRRNGIKHGLTGQGVVVLEDDSAEVDQRTTALQQELAPQTILGAILVRQMALLSVRMERGGRQELARLASRVRHSTEDFDEARLDEADRLFDSIADRPSTALRKLRRSPEGVDRLVLAWRDLRARLTRAANPTWTVADRDLATNLMGRRADDPLGSKIDGLAAAVQGNFAGLADSEVAHLDDDARTAWARSRLVERIDREIAGLEEHRATLDLGAIALDRADAHHLALFDPSREATLARRYEREAQGFASKHPFTGLVLSRTGRFWVRKSGR